MTIIIKKSHIGVDGLLKLTIPIDIKDMDVEVLLNVKEISSKKQGSKNNWPTDFIEKTYGCLADEPLYRSSQGTFGGREELK